MNPAYDEVLAAGADTMLSAFDTTASRLGTASQNIEKDFWVCWTLDALFNGLREGGPRLLFKGGTSLSKGFGLISRFSEDIDVTVFRDDLGEPASIEELDGLSGKKRRARLDAIKDACQAYISGPLCEELTAILQARLEAGGLADGAARVEADDSDPDSQTLLVWYPAATPRSDYVRAAIKIESGAKSALDPNHEQPIKPYVDDDLPALDLTVLGVRTVDPERTFWDKVVILHGLRRWFDTRGELRGGNQRVSRHYYDLFRLAAAPVGATAIADAALGQDCVAHARMFFNRPDFDLASAMPGTFALMPHDTMVDQLRIDYRAMQGMIFGEPPSFEAVLDSIGALETRMNGMGAWQAGGSTMKQSEGAAAEEPGNEIGRGGDVAITPLHKRRLTGEPYTRDPKVETMLAELALLSRDALIVRASIPRRADPRFIPSECLLYFVRASRHDNNEALFERLYRLLTERVLRSLPKAESPDGKTESLTRGIVRDKVFNRFVELLSSDRADYAEKLDYFEVRFDGALASLRRDAQDQAWRDENRSQPLEYDEESGELSPEVEAAAGTHDPFAASEFDDPTYRSRLDAAIDALPTEQSRIIHMLSQGFPIDSKEPDIMTIAKAIGRSEKTIRTYRDKAFAALRAAMEGEDQ